MHKHSEKAVKLRLISSNFLKAPIGEFTLVVLLFFSWINPDALELMQPGFFASIPFLFVAEFIFGHAGVGFSLPVFFVGFKRWLAAAFVIALYGVFLTILWKVGHQLTVLTFTWISISRVCRAELDFTKNPKIKHQNKHERDILFIHLALPAFLRFFYLIFSVLPVMLIPLPKFGLSSSSLVFMGSGVFVDYPQNLIFGLIVYFASIGRAERKVFPVIQEWIRSKV